MRAWQIHLQFWMSALPSRQAMARHCASLCRRKILGYFPCKSFQGVLNLVFSASLSGSEGVNAGFCKLVRIMFTNCIHDQLKIAGNQWFSLQAGLYGNIYKKKEK